MPLVDFNALLSADFDDVAEAPGFGVSQQGHRSCVSWFWTMHVGHDQPLGFLNNSLSGFSASFGFCAFFSDNNELLCLPTVLFCEDVAGFAMSVAEEDCARKSSTLPCFSCDAGSLTLAANITGAATKRTRLLFQISFRTSRMRNSVECEPSGLGFGFALVVDADLKAKLRFGALLDTSEWNCGLFCV